MYDGETIDGRQGADANYAGLAANYLLIAVLNCLQMEQFVTQKWPGWRSWPGVHLRTAPPSSRQYGWSGGAGAWQPVASHASRYAAQHARSLTGCHN